MRYHYEPPNKFEKPVHGSSYNTNHPVYSICTLYLQDSKGLAVIQQRYNPFTKQTWWTDIDPFLVDDLYSQPGFADLFEKYAKPADWNGLYPTLTVRQVMWSLKMKPLKREPWETCFDKSPI